MLSCTSCNSSRQATTVDAFQARLRNDPRLLDHILTRNKAKIAGFLVARYHLEVEDILTLVQARHAGATTVTVPDDPRNLSEPPST